jgi:hypothetical protein
MHLQIICVQESLPTLVNSSTGGIAPPSHKSNRITKSSFLMVCQFAILNGGYFDS